MLSFITFIVCILVYVFFKFAKGIENIFSNMSEEQEQVRCSSSESENFEKIESEEAGRDEGKSNADFTVGEESEQEHPEDGPSHEGRDSFPNAPPPNIRRVLTVAQQLALAEKRSKLRRRPAFILLVKNGSKRQCDFRE
ncbi:unnamed protein product [Arctia plantaginis]|uniref:Uncharacterized protein n=1 Tax=Arctia plantaginis TaxID=874455 RepID=A0A8S0ZJQ8_ARCPL|nr:unnamed protein product [Arctia plantaginis]